MQKRFAAVARHAGIMVKRTFRSYGLLSVTIVLSFSLFLGYLFYTDSSIYNRYKDIMGSRRGDIVVDAYPLNLTKTEALLQNLEKIDQTVSYVSYYCNWGQTASLYYSDAYEDPFILGNVQAFFIPDYAWLDSLNDFYLYPSSADIVWIDNAQRDGVVLCADEVIISEKIYYAFGMDKEKQPVYTLRSVDGLVLQLNVVGYLKSQETISYEEKAWSYTPPMLLSTKLMDYLHLLEGEYKTAYGMELIDRQYIVIHSAAPEEVTKLLDTMKFETYRSVYEQQNEALETIRVEKRNKAIIACALLLLLGINLYSSFSNALNDRKFEIGVKRAIGASGWSIVRQFLYESLLVMAVNIALAVVLVTDIAIVYKYIYERIPDALGSYNRFVLYISPYSLGMFGLCAVTLTVVFSLIFAYQSTQVEIVQYLKAE